MAWVRSRKKGRERKREWRRGMKERRWASRRRKLDARPTWTIRKPCPKSGRRVPETGSKNQTAKTPQILSRCTLPFLERMGIYRRRKSLSRNDHKDGRLQWKLYTANEPQVDHFMPNASTLVEGRCLFLREITPDLSVVWMLVVFRSKSHSEY